MKTTNNEYKIVDIDFCSYEKAEQKINEFCNNGWKLFHIFPSTTPLTRMVIFEKC